MRSLCCVILLCILCFFGFTNANALCLDFCCTSLKGKYYEFVWNNVLFFRTSEKYVTGYVLNTCFNTFVNCDKGFVKDSLLYAQRINLDSIVYLSGEKTSNWQGQKCYNPYDEKTIRNSPKNRIIFSYPYIEGIRLYLMLRNVKEVDAFLEKIITKRSYVELDTISEFVQKKVNCNESLKYESLEPLNVLSNRFFLIRLRNTSIDVDEQCAHWIGVEKNKLSFKEIDYLNKLTAFPLAPLDSSGKIIFNLK